MRLPKVNATTGEEIRRRGDFGYPGPPDTGKWPTDDVLAALLARSGLEPVIEVYVGATGKTAERVALRAVAQRRPPPPPAYTPLTWQPPREGPDTNSAT